MRSAGVERDALIVREETVYLQKTLDSRGIWASANR